MANFLRIIPVFIIVLLSIAAMNGSARSEVNYFGHPDRLELIQALKKGDYGKLKAILISYQHAFEEGRASDMAVRRTYGAFANSDPALEKHLTNWVEEQPDFYGARLARGVHYRNLGYEARGSSYVKETMPENFKRMANFHDMAANDFINVIDMKANSSLAYGMLINLAMAKGWRHAIENWLKSGLEAVPKSEFIPYMYLWAQQPQWGGKLKTVIHFVEKFEKENGKNRVYGWMRGYADFYRATVLARYECRHEARPYFDKALEFEFLPEILLKRARNYYCIEDYRSALKDLNRVLDAVPHSSSALDFRSRIYAKQRRYGPAMEDRELTIKLDGLSASYLVQRARLYERIGDNLNAEADYTDAMVYGANDAWTRRDRGRFYSKIRRFSEAVENFKVAAQIQPNKPLTWRWLFDAQISAKQCDAIDSGRRYLAVCKSSRHRVCAKKERTVIRNYLNSNGAKSWCPDKFN